MTTPQEKALIRTKLEQFEGCVEHMYLDTKGYVTVGIGHLLATVGDAQKLAFVWQKDNKAATKEDIANDYDAVRKQVKGLFAFTYKRYTKLKLRRATIDSLTNSHIDQFEIELRSVYGKDFDTYPTEVRLALFDMIFNLGMTELRTGFPKFNGFIKARRWADAATECNRRDIGDDRNTYVRELLENAAKKATAVAGKP